MIVFRRTENQTKIIQTKYVKKISKVKNKNMYLNPTLKVQRRGQATPFVGLSGEVKHTTGEITLFIYVEGINMSTKFLVVDYLHPTI